MRDAPLSVRPSWGDELGLPAPALTLFSVSMLPGPVLSARGLEAVSEILVDVEPALAMLEPLC